MGRIDKGVKCSVSGCSREAVRSLSTGKAKAAGLNVGSRERRVYVCREHYKEFKKKTKRTRLLISGVTAPKKGETHAYTAVTLQLYCLQTG